MSLKDFSLVTCVDTVEALEECKERIVIVTGGSHKSPQGSLGKLVVDQMAITITFRISLCNPVERYDSVEIA